MNEGHDVIVIGAGVVGLMIAMQIREAGAGVVIVDDGTRTPASVRNAGLIVPSYSEPVPSRDDIAHFLRSAFSGGSTVGMSLPKTSPEVRWMFEAATSALNGASHRRRAELLIRLSDCSLRLLERTIRERALDVGWKRTGSLQVFDSPASLKNADAHVQRMRKLGVEADVLNREAARKIEPLLHARIEGAIHYPGDAAVDPVLLTEALRNAAMQQGIRLIDARVVEFIRIGERVVGISTSSEEIRAERIVVAAGAWSAALLSKLGVRLPIVPGKGYALDVAGFGTVQRPLILHDSHVVVTPLSDRIRFTTGLQLVGFDSSTSERVMQHIRKAVDGALNGVRVPTASTLLYGFRPLSPDGVPIVGALKRHPELIVAGGHGVLGVTLAAHTGELVKRLASGEHADDARYLSPRRFGI